METEKNTLQKHLESCIQSDGLCSHLFQNEANLAGELPEDTVMPATLEELERIGFWHRSPKSLIKRGQVWAVKSQKEVSSENCPAALFMVLSVNEEQVRVLPVSHEVWAASERDLIIGISNELMVETWNDITIPTASLWHLFLQTTKQEVKFIEQMMEKPRLLLVVKPPLSKHIGQPIIDRNDERIEFHKKELERIRAFCSFRQIEQLV